MDATASARLALVMRSRGSRTLAAGAATVIGLQQGAVPLVVKAVWGRESRLAPASRLDAPWWWLACAAIALVALVVVLVLEPDEPSTPDAGDARATSERGSTGPATDDRTDADPWHTLSAIVVLVGFYNGVAPLIARLALDGDLLLSLPLRLSAPWWWIASLAVIVASAVALVAIDEARGGLSGGGADSGGGLGPGGSER
jgi:hypothetical protein